MVSATEEIPPPTPAADTAGESADDAEAREVLAVMLPELRDTLAEVRAATTPSPLPATLAAPVASGGSSTFGLGLVLLGLVADSGIPNALARALEKKFSLPPSTQ